MNSGSLMNAQSATAAPLCAITRFTNPKIKRKSYEVHQTSRTSRERRHRQKTSAGCSRVWSEQSDPFGVAVEEADVLPNPVYGLDLIQETKIASRSIVSGGHIS